MRPLRNMLDRLKPNFGKDGALYKFFPVLMSLKIFYIHQTEEHLDLFM